ncbi:MAG: MarR family transcriptional regulator, partial [Vallitaleaceae bacterium]|nr:MarR family transcriptional regulator [Vallitaleaceae bacterium]
MDREFLLLMHISEGGAISQRSLAKVLDVSLGTVNGLMQQMLQEGLLTVDTSNPKQIKYTLTEHGIIRKASLYYDWIVQSYHTISKTKFHIKGIVEKQISKGV